MAIDKKAEIAGAPAYPASRLNARERKVLETADQYVPAVAGNWPVAPTGVDDALDKAAARLADVSTNAREALVVVEYDFDEDGGAVSDIDLGVTVPAGAIITEVISDVLVAPDSGTSDGTLRLNVPTDGNLSAAITADDGASGVSAESEPPVKLAADRELRVTIATAALTAGRVRYHVRYLRPVS